MQHLGCWMTNMGNMTKESGLEILSQVVMVHAIRSTIGGRCQQIARRQDEAERLFRQLVGSCHVRPDTKLIRRWDAEPWRWKNKGCDSSNAINLEFGDGLCSL